MKFSRRTVLRGTMGGATVGIGLPLLDCFLNNNGNAFAGTNTALPPIFGVWFQHLGLNPGAWEPKKVGPNYDNNVQLTVLDPLKHKINIFSGMKYFIIGRPSESHITGVQISMTGAIPEGAVNGGPSLDTTIGDVIGKRTRFKSLEVSLDGSRSSASQRNGRSRNPSEPSPAALYKRIFVEGFTDPNAAEFTPDPRVMVRRSALSAVAEHRNDVMRQLGAADRVRLDEYFSSLRQVEQQLALELEKPAPLEACVVPAAIEEKSPPGAVLDDAWNNNRLFAKLLAHALACGQTQVFNLWMGSQGLRTPGSSQTWHMCTHEESIDPNLGYQKLVVEVFTKQANEAFLEFLQTLDGFKEGPGSLLDRSIVMWLTDHMDGRMHGIENVPVMTAGSGAGRIKTGIHVHAPGDSVTRAGLTVQQALGVPIEVWGEGANRTSKTITEIMA